jgi:NADPH2:quinone reductase
MNKIIRMYQTGGPEVLVVEDDDPGQPGPGQVRIRHEAIGVNFIDIYHRTGLYPLPGLPAVPGMEGAGVVESAGAQVTDFNTGDRVAYAGLPPGAYAHKRLIPAHRLVALPAEISFEQAAAIMLKGMTARYLLYGCFPVKSGDTILVHAAAGGVGTILCQWARYLGARVIGTVGSEEKAVHATAHGCQHTILYQKENFVERVMQITGGKGVDVVYDSVGQMTFLKSLDCLRPLGMMVSFGQASGSVEPFNIGLLAAKGSLFLTRPSLMKYTEERKDLIAHARDLFEVIAQKAVKVEIGQKFALEQAADAHRALESRGTRGATIMIP